MAELGAEELSTLAGKVSSFMDGLSAPEREFLTAVLASVSTDGQTGDVEGFGSHNADRMQIAVHAQEQAINSLPQVGLDATSRDRRKAGLDNIQKFLDLVRGMNPQI